MKKNKRLLQILAIASIILALNSQAKLEACSTIKLQHGKELLYGHNLNQGDIGVPGMVFINRRGIFKIGRTWEELTTANRSNPSGFHWISRYGSVTFNNFSKDMPDGGMNEVGLYIWEMNDDPQYPKNTDLPKLNQTMWMQYILDNCVSTDEALQCAYQFEVEGWGWHFFIGDATGKTASVHFRDGKPIVHAGEDMPVPGLFNTPYNREMEILKYYEGFGGQYPIDMKDPEVPRFVKTAKMMRDYSPSGDIIKDGFKMLDNVKVYDEPEWSIIMDVRRGHVYFKTRINPEIKSFSMADIDFSNEHPTLVMDMDYEKGGDVMDQFKPYTNQLFEEFTEIKMFPMLPDEFFSAGGITKEIYKERMSSHCDEALKPDKQFFTGKWTDEKKEIYLHVEADGNKVKATSSNYKDVYPVSHISLIGEKLVCTFTTKSNKIVEIKGIFEDNKLKVEMEGARFPMGSWELERE